MSLQAKDLCLGYGDTPVLREVNLSLEAGSFLAILGPNGCGKSTLLQALSGVRPPQHGRVTLDGLSLSEWDPRALARRRSVLAQNTELGFDFTVFEVALLGRAPHMLRAETPEDHDIARSALQAMDLGNIEHRRYLSLSGGERQRVHCARALAQVGGGAPAGRVLLLDEPTNNLDPAHRFALLDAVRNLCGQGLAVAAILHDPNLALAYADHVLLLKDGVVLARGETKKVLSEVNVSKLYDINTLKLSSPEGHVLFHLSPLK